MSGKRFLHYQIVEELGRGGMGVVYKALDTRLQRPVALKFLAPDAVGNEAERARLLNEARAAAAIRHPNICPVYDIGEVDGEHFISMAYIEGSTLRDRITRGPLAVDESLRIVLQLADGLSAAHASRVTHRDIKSANIRLTERGDAVILDFGVAKSATSASVTQTSTFSGTIAYASPEQIQAAPVDQRTDLWSLGVVWFEMLTGALPFVGDTVPALIQSILYEAPRWPPGGVVPAGIARILSRLLAKNPDDRYASAAELRDEVGTLLSRGTSVSKGAAIPSIAVLPFTNMSVDPEQDYFCAGVAEDIINDLTRLEGLRVAARTTSFAYKDAAMDIREIGRKIGVDTVLEGGVRKAGNRLRITAQLIDVVSGYDKWSGRWDREMADVFAIQDEIATAIVGAMRVHLTEQEKTALAKPQTTDVEAYDLYLRAIEKMHRTRQDRLAAHALLRQAIARDPTFARAHAMAAVTSMFLYQFFNPDSRYLHESLEAAQRALDLDSQLAEAHAAKAYALASTKRHDEAEREFEIAARLNPDLYETYYFWGRARWMQGRRREAIEFLERSIALDPAEYQAACLVVTLCTASDGDRQELAAKAERGLDRVSRHLEKNPEDTRAIYLSVAALEVLGRRDDAAARVEQALSLDPNAADVLYNAACFFALRHQSDRALEYLDRAIAAGFNSYEWIQNDPDLDLLRHHARYTDIVGRIQ